MAYQETIGGDGNWGDMLHRRSVMHGLLSSCDFVFKCMTLMLNFACGSSHSTFTSHMKSLSNPRLSKCSNANLLYPSQLAFIPNSSILVTATSSGALSVQS
jgi:hypothetical protein